MKKVLLFCVMSVLMIACVERTSCPGVENNPDSSTCVPDSGANVPDTSVAEPDAEVFVPTYPEGPYGINEGDIIADYFVENLNGNIYLHDLYSRPEYADYTMLLIVGGGAACGFCNLEEDEIEENYEWIVEKKFLILGDLFLDEGWAWATPEDAAEYFGPHGSNAQHPYGSDPWGASSIAVDFNPPGVPLNIVVGLDEGMKIWDVIVGYPGGIGIPGLIEMWTTEP